MAKTRRVRKRCEKCGAVGYCKPRERRCKRTSKTSMLGTYACWGKLVRVHSIVEVARSIGVLPKQTKRPQDVAVKNLEHARKMAERYRQRGLAAGRAANRAYTKQVAWTKRADRYAARAAMTDEQVAAERARREAATATRRAARAKRGIKIGATL